MTRPEPNAALRRGVAAVEFAVVMPLLLLFLVGTWEVGRMIEVQQILSNASREGARRAATGLFTIAETQQAVIDYLNSAGISPTTPPVVTAENTTNPTPQPPALPTDDPLKGASPGDVLKVTVTVKAGELSWGKLWKFGNASTQLTSTAFWGSMKDVPYPESASKPSP